MVLFYHLWGILVNVILGHSWYNFLGEFDMLKKYRERANISQEELEQRINIDRKTIFRIENDLNMPMLDTFAKIVIELGLSDEEIASEVKKSINITKKNR